MTLREALVLLERMHPEMQQSEVPPESAAHAMGSKSLSGSARSKLAVLNSYGLIDRARGKLKISPLGLGIVKPLGQSKESGIREAALKPALFASIWANHRDLSEKVLATTLLHQGLEEKDANDAARIFKDNIDLAKPDQIEDSSLSEEDNNESRSEFEKSGSDSAQLEGTRVIGTYTTMVGENDVTLTFTGSGKGHLVPEDFDGLIDYAELLKKQLERRIRAEEKRHSFPVQAVWSNNDHDQPVTIIGVMGRDEGTNETYFKSSDGTGIAASELKFL